MAPSQSDNIEAQEGEVMGRQLLYSLVSRMSMGNTQTYGGLRDVWTALGYPGDGKLSFDDYWLRYKRQDVAAAVVEKPVEGSWRQLPIVRGVDDGEKFQGAWEELEDEFGIYRTLIRADIMSRICQYSTVMIGFEGEEEMNQEVGKAGSLLYLQPYLQKHSQIKSYMRDQTDPRFGLPEIYSIQVDQAETKPEQGTSTTTIDVHYSRILHVADNLVESNVYGMPAMERVYNRLLNLELIVGGSAEMFWRGAFPGMAFNLQEGTRISEDQRVLLEQEIQNYVHDLQRYMKLQGMDIKELQTQVADPEKHADVQMKFISVATGIPKRILEGSERGELASSQDSESWNNKCDHRRRNHIEANILRPFIDRLGRAGVLEVPKEYEVEWPDLESQSDEAKAKVGKDRTEALAKYADSPSAPLVVPPEAWLREIMELPEEKVERIADELKRSGLGDLEDKKEKDEATDDEVGFQDQGNQPNQPNQGGGQQ